MDQAEITQQWLELVRLCDAKVAECVADPASAELEGITPDYQSSIYADFVTFGGRGERQAQNDTAAWLRAVAKLMIDETIWNYRIYEAMGGKAFLALLSFNGIDEHDFGGRL